MSASRHPPFATKEVTVPRSRYAAGMEAWLERIFPEYCPPRFDHRLSTLRRPDGRHQVQIFVGLVDGDVAGLAQAFYREWQGGLLADLDLLGVLEPFRRSGLALALVRRTLRAASEMAGHYGLPAVGIATLIDPHYPPIVELHRKQGGQIRTDYQCPWGDIIVWYPLRLEYEGLPTPVLAEQLEQFGPLIKS